MAGQGYPDEGADHRLIPGLGPLQKAGIIHAPAPVDVEQKTTKNWRFTFQLWPPFVMIERRRQGDEWKQFRLGWPWRKKEKYYIPGAALKNEQGLEPDYTGARDDDGK